MGHRDDEDLLARYFSPVAGVETWTASASRRAQSLAFDRQLDAGMRQMLGDGKGFDEDGISPAMRMELLYQRDKSIRKFCAKVLEHEDSSDAVVDAFRRAEEDRMDCYAVLLEEGRPPIEVLIRAALRFSANAPAQEIISAASTFLREAGGITAREQKKGRQIVRRWLEGGRHGVVPAQCWAMLVNELPASALKERLAEMGGMR